MKIISLGWGVQSFTLAAMVALGELEPVDAVIHSDTTNEHQATYAFAEKWTPWLQEHGVTVITVRPTDKKLVEFHTHEHGWVYIPAATINKQGKPGRLRRQCTQDWKVMPLRKYLQANRQREPVEMWLGISMDEVERMRHSDVQYITHRYPLIEKRMTRQDCINWLTAHGLEVPHKSSCVFCPYHDRGAWREMWENKDGDWQKAVAVDEAIRHARPPFELYVHGSCKPLAQIANEIDAQPPLMSEECNGYCFL